MGASGGAGRRAVAGRPVARRNMITEKQRRVLRKVYARTQNMSVSAMKAGVDRKTARRYLDHPQASPGPRRPHAWRTRPDPLASAWPRAEAILAEAPELEAKALLEHLMEAREPGLNAGHLRTFQRRVQQWRATRGPEQAVMFGQQRPPGEVLQVDWTHPGDLEVSVQGRRLEHLLCHGVLPHSNWQWALRCQSESFLSLLRTLQACLGMLGRAPRFLSTDNSSSATHEVAEGKRGYNKAYAEACTHFGLVPRTINVGCPNEHGDVESANRHLKRRMEQHLLLRGSRDFASEEAYDGFVAEVLSKANRPRAASLEGELEAMHALPGTWLAEYREVQARVSSHSTIRVRNVSYSVPSRLIGREVRVEVHESELRVHLGRDRVATLPRRAGDRGAVIDFRHVVGPLLRKPGAFAQYEHREQMYPMPEYRAAHDRLVADHGPRDGVVEYLRVLRAAAEHGVEAVGRAMSVRMAGSRRWTAVEVAREVAPRRAVVEDTPALEPELGSYDLLLEGGGVGDVG